MRDHATTPVRQTLPPAHYAAVHADIRAHMAGNGLDLLLLDSNDDVLYATGFAHYTTERPVVFAITQDLALLLLPKLELSHAAHQHAAAEIVPYFEFPGIESPFAALAAALGQPKGQVGVPPSLSLARFDAIGRAFPGALLQQSTILGQMRLIKSPAEIALHREAAQISDEMVQAGVPLIAEVLRKGAALIAEQTCASADLAGLDHIRAHAPEDWLLHRVGHGMGVMFHEPPGIEAGDQTLLQPGMIVSSEPSIAVPGVAGYRIADTVLITEHGPDCLTRFPRGIDDVIIG
jgi:Xaa-Pro aminopeptidase